MWIFVFLAAFLLPLVTDLLLICTKWHIPLDPGALQLALVYFTVFVVALLLTTCFHFLFFKRKVALGRMVSSVLLSTSFAFTLYAIFFSHLITQQYAWVARTGHAVIILASGILLARLLSRPMPLSGLRILFGIDMLLITALGILQFVSFDTILGTLKGSQVPQEKILLNQITPSGETVPRTKPNVMIILIDTLRPDHLSAYGYERKTSPNIDALAEEGILYRNAFATSNFTGVSIASLFTSLYPVSHRFFNYRNKLSQDWLTLPEFMQHLGYGTAAFSTAPVISREFGFSQGFDHFYLTGGGSFIVRSGIYKFFGSMESPWTKSLNRVFVKLRSIAGMMPGGEQKAAKKTREKTPPVKPEAPPAPGKVLARPLGDFISEPDGEALQAFRVWFKKHFHKPFFAYIHLLSPHPPYAPPQPFRKFSRKALPVKYQNPPRNPGNSFPAPEVPDDMLDGMIREYDGEILFSDYILGKIVAELKDRKVFDNTLLIILSDHGEEFYDHGQWGHGRNFYDSTIRIAMIIHPPAPTRRHTVVEEPVSLVDIYPTILKALDFNIPVAFSGIDIRPDALSASSQRDSVYSHNIGTFILIDKNHKVILNENRKNKEDGMKIFDLRKDPGEKINLALQDKALAGSYLNSIEMAKKSLKKDILPSEAAKNVDEEMLNRIRGMGYLI